MEDHIKQYAHIILRMEKIINFLMAAKADKVSLDQLDHRVQAAKEFKTEIVAAKRDLFELCTTTEDHKIVDDFIATFYDFYDKVLDLTSSVSRLIKEHLKATAGTSGANTATVNSTSQDIILPKIEIEKFNGEICNFISFWDLFNSAIDKKTNLTPAQKLWYLKTLLTGEAASLLRHLKPEDANYAEAKEILETRYKKPEVIARHFIDQFLNQPSFSSTSASALKKLHSISDEAIRGLKALEKESRDIWLIHILLGKVDIETRRWWFDYEVDLEDASITDFLRFIQFRFEKLESAASMSAVSSHSSSSTPSSASKGKVKANDSPAKRSSRTFATVNSPTVPNKPICPFCKLPKHSPYQCSVLKNLPIEARIDMTKKLGLCVNCLRPCHGNQCEYGTCRICNTNCHHTLLHVPETSPPRSEIQSSTAISAPVGLVSSNKINETMGNALLSTAIVHIKDNRGQLHYARVFLDAGSQSCFVSSEYCNRIGLKRFEINLPVSGISEIATTSKHGINITVVSRTTQDSWNFNCAVLSKITTSLPTQPISIDNWNIPKDIELADPTFHTPGKVDILIGNKLFFKMLVMEQIKLGDGLPILQNTKLGWILGGEIPTESQISFCSFATVDRKSEQLNDTMKQFWEVEEIHSTSAKWSTEEQECEKHFEENTSRNVDGRFVVRIPFKRNFSQLGDSKEIASKRLFYILRRLQRNPELQSQYQAFIQEYHQLRHMTLVSPSYSGEKIVYLPHHCVIKESSSTTKLRVVFDASAKTSSGLSLNDTLKIGPVVQDLLFNILLRFRKHAIAITGDIEKMYRQILVHPENQNLIRILWESDTQVPIEYKMNTLTYGTASAPYLATRCLVELGRQNANDYPVAAHCLQEDFYVDDCLSGASTVEEALRLRRQLTDIIGSAGMHIRKWASNCNSVLADIPEEDREVEYPLDINKDATLKTLGVKWNPQTDNIQYTVSDFGTTEPITKRSILSNIAKIFDPLGLLAPVIVVAKILMQQLWKMEIAWDEPVPCTLRSSWIDYTVNLQMVNELRIPRRICDLVKPAYLYLHGYCDASEVAYGSVVYLVAVDGNGNRTSNLICSKSRVAPLKKLSLPRLELLAAHQLAKLMHIIMKALKLDIDEISAFSDSTITLAWIAGESYRWKTFVANRVEEIRNLIPPENWHHVSTDSNPADLVSRGTTPSILQDSKLYWHGPDYDISSQLHPQNQVLSETEIEAINLEKKIQVTALVVNSPNIFEDLISHISDYHKLLRITAYVQRFMSNAKGQASIRTTGPLSVDELDKALILLIRHVQASSFAKEIQLLQNGSNLQTSTKLQSLTPFIQDGLVRVGGRLQNSDLDYSAKHPLLLPHHHTLTKLIFENEHKRLLHIGQQGLLTATRQKYYVPNGRSLARQIVRKCMICFRAKPTLSFEQMGNLPAQRSLPTPPFYISGVDFGGPFLTLPVPGKGQRSRKTYICLFVCFATKAIHLEVVSDLTTDAFIAALKRFSGRRGWPKEIWSDNATNFVGTKRKLEEFHHHFVDENHLNPLLHHLAQHKVEWKFIPPHSPHIGGLWEAGIKSAKHHLKRIMVNQCLTLEEFRTLAIQIEAVLNSRPITPLSTDPNDLQPLTPAHFLIGRPLTALPEPTTELMNLKVLSRWEQVQKMSHLFWKRWHTDYLTHLQAKTPRIPNPDSIQQGDLVLIMDDNLPSLQWPTARVQDIHPGTDRRTRVVTLWTGSGTTTRAIRKLCKLPISKN